MSSYRPLTIALLILSLPLLAFAAVLIAYGNVRSELTSRQASTPSPQGLEAVLAEQDASPSGSFIVNVPSIFTGSIDVKDRDVNLGTGNIYAANLEGILTGILQGEGILVEGGETPTIVNSDPGSAQEIFKSIKVGDTTITADANDDVLEITGDGVTVSDGKIKIGGSSATVTNVTNNYTSDTSGFQDNGSVVTLRTAADSLAIGTAVAQGKLTVVATGDQPAMVVQAAAGQTTNLAEWKDEDGTTVVSFDTQGNAVFNGTIIQGGVEIESDVIGFAGEGTTLTLDVSTAEPNNLLTNPNLEVDATGWIASSPTAANQTVNGTFNSSIDGWSGSLSGAPYPELFANTGYETDIASWDFSGGGLSTFTYYNTVSPPYFITTGSDGNMYYSTTTNRIGKITTSGVVTEYATTSSLAQASLTNGPDGNIWFGTGGSARVGKFNVSTNAVTEYTVSNSTLGIASGPDGNIWYTNNSSDRIGRITTNGVDLGTFFFPSNDAPYEIVAGPDGNMWVTFESSNQVGKLTLGGTLSVVGTTSTLPRGITVGPDNNIWVAIFSAARIGRVDVTTDTYTEFTMPTNGHQDIVSGPDGNLWYTVNNFDYIGKITTTGTVTQYGPTCDNPRGMTVGDDGNIWFACRMDNRIGKFQLNGPERVTSPTLSGTSGSLKIPSGSSDIFVQQSVNVGNTRPHEVSAYVYIDGSTAVSSSYAQIAVNGTPVSSSYTSVGSGWYKVSATVNGAASSVPYGVVVKSGRQVYIDGMSLKQAIPAEFHTAQFYNNIGSSLITAPVGNNATFFQSLPFTNNSYTLTMYAYTNGSAVTTGDIELYFNGATIPTSISSTATPGWYRLTGAFSATDGTYGYGALVKAGRSVAIDDISLTLASVSDTSSQSSSPTFNGSSGARRINAIGRTPVTFTQDIVVPSDGTYSLFVKIYNDTPGQTGSAIDANMIDLLVNGAPLTGLDFSAAAGGFYQSSGSTFLSAGTYTVGVRVKTGYRLVLDAFSFQQGTGDDKTVLLANLGSGLAKLDVESTTTLRSGVAGNNALIIVGSANQSANLTEWKDNNGNVLSVVDEAGRLGIGTNAPTGSLVVLDDNDTNAPVAFVNTSAVDSPSTGLMRLALGVASSGVDSRYIQFYAGATNETDGTGVGRIRLNNGGVSYESGGADFAEYFAADDLYEYEPGDVVALDTEGKASKTVTPYNENVLGVVSDTAAFIGNAKESYASDSARIVVGLIGQIDMKVSTLSGEIRKGDRLTTSPIAGYAMKATGAGMVLGIALEDFTPEQQRDGDLEETVSDATSSASVNTDPTATDSAVLGNRDGTDDGTISSCEGSLVATRCGTVRAFIDPRWSNPMAQFGDGGIGSVLGLTADATSSAALGSIDLASSEDDTVLDGGLTVLGATNVSDLAVTGQLSAGLLRIDGMNGGDASIDTLAGSLLLQSQASGAIELMGGRVTVDTDGTLEIKEGVLRGNDSFTGSTTLQAGQTVVRVERDWKYGPASVVVSADYNTKTWVTDISKDGFTVNVETAPGEAANLYWLVVFE